MAWVPSQNGGEPVCLHPHRKISELVTSATNRTGLIWVTLCLPSQNGCKEYENLKKNFLFFFIFFYLINGQADLQPALKSSPPCIFRYHLVINVHWRLILTILTFPLDESFPQSFNNFYKIFCNNYLVLSCNSPSSKNCFIHLFELLCYRKGLKGFPPSNNNLEYFFGFPFIMHPLKSQAKVRYLFENTPNSICRVITIHPRRQHRCYFW